MRYAQSAVCICGGHMRKALLPYCSIFKEQRIYLVSRNQRSARAAVICTKHFSPIAVSSRNNASIEYRANNGLHAACYTRKTNDTAAIRARFDGLDAACHMRKSLLLYYCIFKSQCLSLVLRMSGLHRRRSRPVPLYWDEVSEDFAREYKNGSIHILLHNYS